ncbi:hypothetical protein FACS1894172_00160 [Spirochaetia bacterium]|nr:hypothetical protein FACS1894164_06500 [Spirochaetia bacterium]GHU29314.1 hypothetical protein FACS1894172_00160 [Spirochaetia bacterium]
MIRTVVTPDSQQITLAIQEKYLGKELEMLIFPMKDADSVSLLPNKEAAFRLCQR